MHSITHTVHLINISFESRKSIPFDIHLTAKCLSDLLWTMFVVWCVEYIYKNRGIENGVSWKLATLQFREREGAMIYDCERFCELCPTSRLINWPLTGIDIVCSASYLRARAAKILLMIFWLLIDSIWRLSIRIILSPEFICLPSIVLSTLCLSVGSIVVFSNTSSLHYSSVHLCVCSFVVCLFMCCQICIVYTRLLWFRSYTACFVALTAPSILSCDLSLESLVIGQECELFRLSTSAGLVICINNRDEKI